MASLKQEAISEIENMPPNLEASTAKAGASIVSTKLKLTGLLLELPANLKKIEEQLKKQEQKASEMKAAQEGGNL